jgi:phosphoenolpyruvate carboxylase
MEKNKSVRKIPTTMATQHPDNAYTPYWSTEPFISTSKEVEECYRSFADLSCDEYMWDWEGKFVDEAVVDRLCLEYYDYFSRHPLGHEKFLTFRIPNIQKEGQARLARAFAGILSASYAAMELKLHSPPLFEVIHPMTQSARELITLQKKFHDTARFQQKILEIKELKPQHLEIIPLIEGTGTLLKSRRILETYVGFLERFTGRRPGMIRPFIARSDPALDGGFLAAVLSAKAALSEYYLFQKTTGIRVAPIIGAGSLRFRGGLSPRTIEEFLKTYPGIFTVTLQSSFRYDYPFDEVKTAIAKLNRLLPADHPVIYSPRQIQYLNELDAVLVHHYRRTVEGLGAFINQMARHIPPRRERIQHTGHFGYSRQVGKAGLKFPRAITFTAVFYSVGVPPELIGLGFGLKEAKGKNLLKVLEGFYPELPQAIFEIGRFLNKENLGLLAARLVPFRNVQKEIDVLEQYIGTPLGPVTSEDFVHRNYTSNVLLNWIQKQPISEDIVKAAQVRRSLG